jgi:uncharacterized protein
MAKMTRQKAADFLNAKRVAVIGAARNKLEYGHQLLRELQKHGYDVVPVNPNASELAGLRCYANVREITPAVERAVIVLPEDKTEQAVLDCAAAGVKDIWLHRHVAGGVSDHRAIYQAEANGLNLITGYCLFMFLPQAGFIHKLHGGIMRLFGIYPK